MIEPYLEEVRRRVGACLGNDLEALVYGGSLALADFSPSASDVDAFALCRSPLSETRRRDLVSSLRHEALPCPARGLELVLLHRNEAGAPRRRPRYELALVTGAAWDEEVSVRGEDSGLLVDLALCRDHLRHGHAEAFGPVPRPWLAEEVRRTAAWHLGVIHHPFHDPLGHQAVLTALRAWRFLLSFELVSKTRAAELYLELHPEDALVRDALALRRGDARAALDAGRVRRFVRALVP